MLLRHGDSGDSVKDLQRGLNKLGSILLVDGDFGPATRDAVVDARTVLERPGVPEADDVLQQAVAAVPEPFPPLTAAGVTFIARLEVASPGEYRRLYTRPAWPSEQSGITIGIGYDLSFVDQAQLAADWGDRLGPDAMQRLAGLAGAPGGADRLAAVADLRVTLLDAVAVFVARSLPRYLEQTRSIYPQVDGLAPSRRAALVSLVYNRGTRLEDRYPVRQERREMREIQALLAAGRPDDVAGQLDSMARLWEGQPLGGLVRRRHTEARLWRSGFGALQLA